MTPKGKQGKDKKQKSSGKGLVKALKAVRISTLIEPRTARSQSETWVCRKCGNAVELGEPCPDCDEFGGCE